MNQKLFTLILGLLVSSPALAFSRSQHIELPQCGGYADVYHSQHHMTIKLDVANCSNLSVNGKRFKMQQRHGHHYSHVYTWKPAHYRDRLNLHVHSNSSHTADVIHLQADDRHRPHPHHPVSWKPLRPAPVVTVRDETPIYLDESRNTTYLPSCGSRIQVNMDQQKLIVRLEGNSACDRVRLTVFNQQPLVMESVRQLDRSAQTWTFQLPKRVVHPGRNSLTLAVQNSHRDRGEQVRYYFADQQWFFASGGR